MAVSTLSAALLLVCVVGFSSKPASAQSAKSWAKKGDAAELHDDWDAAYEAYKQAHEKKPKDMPYQVKYERLRFQAAVAHVDRGRVLKESGDLQGAMNEFMRALQIDPSNQAAQQQIQAIQSPPTPPSAGALEQMAGQNEVLNSISSVAGPVHLQNISNEPITYHAVEDAKVIFQAIGKSAGLNVIFDPDFQSKRIPVDLNNVAPLDALRIVGTIANAFFKPVTPNTIFIAQNNRTKHTDLDELAIQTFYLTNAIAPNDANEVVTTLRNLLDPSIKVYPVLSQNAIVMRATPDELLLAQKLLNDLDRTRPEVVVDVAVLEVNRDKIRNLGITLPSSITLTPQASPSTSSSSSSSSSSGSSSTTPSNFTLNTLANMNATNFAVTLGGATLTALLNDTDTHILQNPRIRATDGQRSTLKIGSRIPVATGSYNAGVATGTASIGVQTQFQYLDIGVNIDMTPTVHYDREITLKMTIEVLSQTGSVTISNVTEPIIGQRTVNQVIQLKEGEPSILAGIVATEDDHNVTGTPGLGELPFIKYFFSTQSKETKRNEIVFLLIPHIVRESMLTRLNTRAIDTGTMQDIYLRQNPGADGDNSALMPVNGAAPRPTANGASAGAGSAAQSVLNQMMQESQRPTPPTPTPPGTATPPPGTAPATAQPQAAAPTGTPVSLNVVPSTANQTVGSTFQVAVTLANGTDVYSVPMQLQFNPAVLQLVNVDSGEFLSKDGQAVALSHRDDGNGLVTISTSRPPGVKGITGGGSVATLTFKAIAPGDSNLSLVKVGAQNSSLATLPVVGSQAVVHVK